MNTAVPTAVATDSSAAVRPRLDQALDAQRAAWRAQRVPTAEQRRDDLESLKRLIPDNRDAIADASG